MIRVNVTLDYPLTLKAGENLTEGALVKLNASGDVVYADAGDVPIGFVEDAVTSGAYCAVSEPCGLIQVVASDAIGVGEYVKCANDGKVVTEYVAYDAGPPEVQEVTSASAFTVGIAKTASAQDGDKIYIVAFC